MSSRGPRLFCRALWFFANPPGSPLVQLLFALNAVVSGEVVRSADPVIFSFLRDAGGSAVLLFAASASPEGLVWPQLKDLWAFAAIGVGGVYLGQLFLLIAMTYISAFNAMVLDALIPVFTLLLGHAFGVERLRLWADSPRHRRQPQRLSLHYKR